LPDSFLWVGALLQIVNAIQFILRFVCENGYAALFLCDNK
jgi:hypothetical protein